MSLFTHLDAQGKAQMVDVSDKTATIRIARAQGYIHLQPETLEQLEQHKHKKGDVLGVARVAAIMSSKRCAELIPLCHPISLTTILVGFEFLFSPSAIKIQVTAKAHATTGVEMEALTAVCVGLLTLYDMCKAADRGMYIDGVRLLEKSGGRSGHWKASNVK
ncbi:MAG: cyclic pyranopterin monophosphate synthase MoaC [Neisseriales bacterium]|nr:MAG: cyclic pyranopterin monophosphate synthase MoaC [Neisseriales bacterium]